MRRSHAQSGHKIISVRCYRKLDVAVLEEILAADDVLDTVLFVTCLRGVPKSSFPMKFLKACPLALSRLLAKVVNQIL